MRAFDTVAGGQVGSLGQTSAVTGSDVTAELSRRGFAIQTHTVVHHVPVTPTLTKSMAISVAIDEALVRLSIPHTSTHPYRCPSGSCAIPSNTWSALVNWCVTVANGYLAGTYGLPGWASSALHSGSLHGVRLSGLGSLSGFGDWLQENPWFMQSVGDAISNYGEHLTAKNVQDAIKANTAQQLTKADAMSLVSMLQAQGSIPAGKTETVAQGANMASMSPYTMPLLIGGAILLVLLLFKGK